MRSRFLVGLSVLVVSLSLASAARAQHPEDRGTVAFSEWDAGMVNHAGANIRTPIARRRGASIAGAKDSPVTAASNTGTAMGVSTWWPAIRRG